MATLYLVFTRSTQELSPECGSASTRLEPLWFLSGWLPTEHVGGTAKIKKKYWILKISVFLKILLGAQGLEHKVLNDIWFIREWILSFQLYLKKYQSSLVELGPWMKEVSSGMSWEATPVSKLLPSNWERTGAPSAPRSQLPVVNQECVAHSQYSLE